MTLVIQPTLTVGKKVSGGLGGISSEFKVQQCVVDQQTVWEQEVRCETFTDAAAGFLSAAAFVKSCLGKLEQCCLFPSCGCFFVVTSMTAKIYILVVFTRRRAVLECKEEASQGRVRLKAN